MKIGIMYINDAPQGELDLPAGQATRETGRSSRCTPWIGQQSRRHFRTSTYTKRCRERSRPCTSSAAAPEASAHSRLACPRACPPPRPPKKMVAHQAFKFYSAMITETKHILDLTRITKKAMDSTIIEIALKKKMKHKNLPWLTRIGTEGRIPSYSSSITLSSCFTLFDCAA